MNKKIIEKFKDQNVKITLSNHQVFIGRFAELGQTSVLFKDKDATHCFEYETIVTISQRNGHGSGIQSGVSKMGRGASNLAEGISNVL